ncbi:MAG: DegT/DnrJ/EryC1/StrS family aminotransferase [Terriglobales bacterium]
MNDKSYIPFHHPSIGQDEMDAVQRVLASGWLTTGPVALQFEKEFAAYVGCKWALAVNSGTSALQLALDAIGLRPGDEVLVPTYTFTATAEVVTYFGARPVLCDSLAGGFNIDPADVERRITSRTRAIIPVHIAGEPCDLEALHEIARRHRLHVIEDAAHSLPAWSHGRRIGTISEMTAFSFYATKTITTGEGGMLTTDDDGYAERARTMRLHGIGGDAWKRYSKAGSWFYEVHHAGYKLNLPDILAAVGVAQLQKVDLFWKQRCQVAARYLEKFSEVEELELPPAGSKGSEHSWHLFILRLKTDGINLNRDQFIAELKALGIGTSVHFIPLHFHPYYIQEYGYKSSDFPHAVDSYSRALSLPIYPDLNEAQMNRVIESVTSLVTKNRKRVTVALS